MVRETLIRNGASITDTALELAVPVSDLRKLCFAVPRLMDAALEHEEGPLDLAEKNLDEALRSEDPRRKDAVSMFVLRNSARARRRGWITSSSGSVDLSINSGTQPREGDF